MFTSNHAKPKPILTGWSLENIDPDHYFIVWLIYNDELITPATRAKEWCFYEELELDF